MDTETKAQAFAAGPLLSSAFVQAVPNSSNELFEDVERHAWIVKGAAARCVTQQAVRQTKIQVPEWSGHLAITNSSWKEALKVGDQDLEVAAARFLLGGVRQFDLLDVV